MNVFDIIALFIFLAGLFIFLNIYVLKLPSTIGSMIMALFLSLCLLSAGYLIPSLKIDAIHIEEYKYGDIIYQIVLSFLLFSSALNMEIKKLAKHKKAVLGFGNCRCSYFYGSHWNLSLFYAGLGSA